MQRMRILTGRHAGATVDLPIGVHDIGVSDDCDVAISDWTLPGMSLSLTDGGQAVARWMDPTQPDQEKTHAFAPWVPFAFGDVLICIGPCDAPWPSDLKLMNEVFQPTLSGVARRAHSRLRFGTTSVVAGAVVMVACVLGSTVWLAPLKAQEPVETSAALAQRVQMALRRVGADELKVGVSQDQVMVDGIVRDHAQRQAVLASLDGLSTSAPVQRRIVVASDLGETIRATTGIADARVEYVGAGVFRFSAKVSDPLAVEQAVQRVGADLQHIVQRIDVQVGTAAQEEARVPSIPLLSSLNDHDLSVVQTRDGVKHLVLIEPAVAQPQRVAIVHSTSDVHPRARR